MTDGLPLDDMESGPDSGARAALARIDAALERIESAARRPLQPPQATPGNLNAALEESVRGSLAELDTLIARLEQ